MSERDEFEAWWDRHGQFVRAGGGDYEKCFAYAAWNFRATPQQAVPALTDEQIGELWDECAKKTNGTLSFSVMLCAFSRALLAVATQPSQELEKAPHRYQD